jgi:hypothetical protein
MGREDEGDRLAAASTGADGPYAKAYAKLKGRGVQLGWQSMPPDARAKAKRASKTKFSCPECGQNVWVKPDSLLICGACYDDGQGDLYVMLADTSTEAEAA